MKRVIVSIGLLLLCSSAALAENINAASAPDLPSFLSSLRASGCPIPNETADRKDLGGVTAQSVTCTADCGAYPAVSCTTSGTCSAVDRNCSVGQRGYVECNGAYTYCPVCECPEGAVIYEDGGCCIGGRQKTLEYTCIGGSWERTGMTCGGSCF